MPSTATRKGLLLAALLALPPLALSTTSVEASIPRTEETTLAISSTLSKTRVGASDFLSENDVRGEMDLTRDILRGSADPCAGIASGSGEFRIFDPSNTPLSASAYGWTRLFQGREYLPLIDAYDFRARTLWPELGRFGQEDPAGTVDSTNRYQALKGSWVDRTDPFGKYSADVHWGLTLFLADRAGYSPGEAAIVANESVGVDFNPATEPVENAKAGNWGPVFEFHFPIDPSTGTVVANGPTAWKKVNSATTPVELGIAIHVLQDSFSHQNASKGNISAQAEQYGEKKFLMLNFVAPMAKNPSEGITHAIPKDRVEPLGLKKAFYSVDWTFMDPELAVNAGLSTYEALLIFRNKQGASSYDETHRLRKKWPEIEPLVRAFAVADTKRKKREWFGKFASLANAGMPWSDLMIPDE